MNCKINDWVEILEGYAKGRICKIFYISFNGKVGVFVKNNKRFYTHKQVKKCSYIHKHYSFGICELSIFKLKKKFSIRLTISKGWE